MLLGGLINWRQLAGNTVGCNLYNSLSSARITWNLFLWCAGYFVAPTPAVLPAVLEWRPMSLSWHMSFKLGSGLCSLSRWVCGRVEVLQAALEAWGYCKRWRLSSWSQPQLGQLSDKEFWFGWAMWPVGGNPWRCFTVFVCCSKNDLWSGRKSPN